MNRRYALRHAVSRAIGEQTATEEQVFGVLDGIFTPEFLEQNCTEGEFHKVKTVLQTSPWANELRRFLGVE